MREYPFIPVRVDEDDYVELTFEDFEKLMGEIYDRGFKDGQESVRVINIPDTQKNWWEGQKGWWENPPMWRDELSNMPSSTCSTYTVNVAPSSVSYSSSNSQDNGTTTYDGCLTFDECVEFLKNRK